MTKPMMRTGGTSSAPRGLRSQKALGSAFFIAMKLRMRSRQVRGGGRGGAGREEQEEAARKEGCTATMCEAQLGLQVLGLVEEVVC